MIMIGIIMLFAGGLAAGEPVVASAGSGDAGIIEAVPDGPLELDRRYGHVVGIVYDRSGATVPRATVEIEGRTAGGDEFYARTYTGRTGKFGFRKVPAGKYEVRAWKRGVGKDAVRIVLREGEVARLRFCLH